MNAAEFMAFCKSFTAVTVDYPFGEQPTCYRVGGKIFAEVYPKGRQGALRILCDDETVPKEKLAPMAVLRCTPEFGDFYTKEYPGAVFRPYYSPEAQHPYARTVLFGGAIPDDEVKNMVQHAYTAVLQKLPKKVRGELEAKADTHKA